ncbi:CA174 protein, partial [Trogon melanurus]|nr:CA174 protein [Trogon melanurus]
CSSHEAADKQPSKRLKCETTDLVDSELEGLRGGNGNLAASGETPKASDGDPCSEDPGDHDTVQQQEGESAAESNGDPQEQEHDVPLKPQAVTSSAPSKMGRGESLQGYVCSEEESSCQSFLSDMSSLKEGDVPKKPMQLDNSALLGEDSNQPMPVDRFFGDVELLQGIPAAALPGTAKSRREFRKLHFVAKEDEEEEEEDV